MINRTHPAFRGLTTRRISRKLMCGVAAASLQMGDNMRSEDFSVQMLQSGLSDYTALNVLNYITGQLIVPVLPAVWMALFQTAPTSDAGTGGTEVPSSNGYARVQVAGSLTTNGTTAAGNATLHFAATVPAWIVAGMSVRDVTAPSVIPAATTVLSTTSTTVVISANVTGAGVGGTDVIVFSAFQPAVASSGNPEPNTLPASVTNTGVVITFPMATGAGWGNITSFGLYDAATVGNLLAWDYLGNFKWFPFTCTSASPGTLTTDTTADAPANASSIVVTQKYGGTLPTLSAGSWSGLLTTSALAGATWQIAGNNTSSIGGGQFRQVTVQSIAANVTASFASGTLIITGA